MLVALALSPGCGASHSAARQAAVTPVDASAGLDGGGTADSTVTRPVDPSQDPFETADWDIVSFSDPRSTTLPAETYDIIDGRVLVAFCDPPVLPVVDPNYFDTERADNDPVYSQVTYSHTTTQSSTGQTMLADPEIAAFIAAENLTVYAEWPMIAGLAAELPEGQSVADAVANWPGEYPGLVEAVDPDAVGTICDFPSTLPNDELYVQSWHLQRDSYNSAPNYPMERPFSADIPAAWSRGYTGSTYFERLSVIAVLDTGVDYDPIEMQPNSTPLGANVYDKPKYTYFRARQGNGTYNGGGEPDSYWLNKSQANARELGHGTCVASVISAATNNRVPNGYNGGISGITSQLYFPVALKADFTPDASGKYSGFSSSVLCNGLCVIGAVKRIAGYKPGEQYGLRATAPFYNIEVANMSLSYKRDGSTIEKRHIKNIGIYITLVASAGNDGTSNSKVFPACSDYVLAVAAHKSDGYRYPTSNYQSYVDISAPGDAIYAVDLSGYSLYGIPFGRTEFEYTNEFGETSAATAIVSGIAGLYTSAHWSYWPINVRGMIAGNGNVIGFHGDANYGRIDCGNLFF
jgi:hypothetical protein